MLHEIKRIETLLMHVKTVATGSSPEIAMRKGGPLPMISYALETPRSRWRKGVPSLYLFRVGAPQ